ncbi:hypothetical protein ROHU_022605 [Labeo rohita]|uniref:Uncharacterized protein n=1 Tax=Labeo rohita TaxID=84645 RepID=A0A498N4W2_LABRO|nr:hypothetical protein ROHU_022605 [Labeo rohita]
MPLENVGEDVRVDTVVGVVVLEEFQTVVVFVCGVVMPGENDGEDVPVETVVDVPVVLEEFCTVVAFVCGVVMPCENDGEGVAVGELWTVGLVTCVNLLVENIDGVAENFFEVVFVVADMLSLGVGMEAKKLVTMEGFWTVDVLVCGVVMPLENVGEDVPVDTVVGVVVIPGENDGKDVPVEMVVDVPVVDSVFMPVENNGDRVLVEIGVGVVDKLLPVGEFWTVDVEICVNLLVEESEDAPENFVEGVAVVLNMLEEEIRLVDGTVDAVVMVVENIGEGVAVEIDVDKSIVMLVMVLELSVVEVVVGDICMLVDDIMVAVVVRDCVFMLVALEEFFTVVAFVCGAVMPCENDGEGVTVEIVVRVVDVLLLVGELWTVGLVTCVNLLVENIDGVAENFIEVVAVVADMLSLGVGMVADKVGGGVAVKIVVRSVNMLVTVEELWTIDVVLCGKGTLADDIIVTAVVEDCVVVLPQFSSQQNILIS